VRRKVWLVLGLAGAALLLLGYGNRDLLAFAVAAVRLRPDGAFREAAAPAAPDYADPAHWAALPERSDAADLALPGAAEDAQASASADVFFLHPTTYYRSGWNQPLADADSNRITDEFVLRNQASAFASCCRIYAPRYRQAVMFAFFPGSGGDGAAALELAYRDVEAAFDYFIEHWNQGRPFILAGHSQGALHGERLLERRISGTPLRERLVAAYLLGHRISKGELARRAPDVPVCASPTDARCLVSWNSVGPRARTLGYSSDVVCVNPLTWRADSEPAPHARNLGALSFERMDVTDAASLRGPWDPRIEPGAADAACREGRLLVSELRSPRFASRSMSRDAYHIHDFNLFYLNLRAGARERVTAYLGGS
jgi:hypothetical protein